MSALTIIGAIVGYFSIGAAFSGWIRSDDDSDESTGAAIASVFIWPIFSVVLLGMIVSDTSKSVFDAFKEKKLKKAQKKKEDLKKIRIQLEKEKQEIAVEQKIIEELDAELEEYNHGKRQQQL